MTKLAGSITELIVLEHGVDGLLTRISDPFWFQSLGCVLGFDWHSSGVTTTTCGAIKEGIKGKEEELGLFVAGGKGAASRKTPAEIVAWGEKTGVDAEMLVDASKTSAKVDSAAVQDGYQLYHHVFLFDRDSNWAVVQQGMNDDNGFARRYHWQSSSVDDFVNEPHAAICCDQRRPSLNLVAKSSESSRKTSTELAKEKPVALIGELVKLKSLSLPKRHEILMSDISPARLDRIFLTTYEAQPETFKDLLCLPGVGAKTIRALSLIAELAYGTEPSYQDPARFGFAHGGKDGIPYPVDRPLYDQTIDLLERAIRKAKLGQSEELQALRRMERYFGESADMPRPDRRRSQSTHAEPLKDASDRHPKGQGLLLEEGPGSG